MKLLSNAPDPLGIASIGFMHQYKGPHLLGWQQFDLLALRLQHSASMAGAVANLPCEQSGMAIYKEIRDTITLRFYTRQLARLKVDDVQLKNVFYDVRRSSNCT